MTQIITVQGAVHKIKNGDPFLIDVREPDEFKTEHIDYALSISLSSLECRIEAWKEATFPVISASIKPPKLSITRQIQIIIGFLVAICVLFGFIGITFAFIIAVLLGGALFFAGLKGGLVMMLAKMPWNK